jgi:Ser/Thr protein kinase RdoA (MazF antagonist)
MKPYENLLRDIVTEFNLGNYADYKLLDERMASKFKLRTSKGLFFLKQSKDERGLALYKTVEEHLNATEVRQARLYSKPNGELISSNGYAVFESLSGQISSEINDRQLESLMTYLVRYNEALRSIRVPESVTDNSSPWKKADSLDYILTQFPGQVATIPLSDDVRTTIKKVLNILERGKESLEKVSKQLIHEDIGPGNIVYSVDEVVSIIDFTPSFGAEIYSLCHFFYWQFLCFNNSKLDHQGIKRALSLYMQRSQLQEIDLNLFYLLFVNAAAFRLFGPILSSIEGARLYSEKSLEKRATLLRLVMEDQIIKSSQWFDFRMDLS